jgi:hypothetical protein
MTIIGSGAARSWTKSQAPRSTTRSISSLQTARMRGSWSDTRRGVKPRFTRLRRCLWRGSSRLIIDGIGGESGRELWREQKVGGSRDSAITSSYRATPHTPPVSSQ